MSDVVVSPMKPGGGMYGSSTGDGGLRVRRRDEEVGLMNRVDQFGMLQTSGCKVQGELDGGNG